MRGRTNPLASRRNGTIYIGSTNDPLRRAWEHRNGVVEGFTQKCDCRLLYDRIALA